MEEQTILSPNRCAFQFFLGDAIMLTHVHEMISLAQMYSEMLGPVIMICTEQGYDFLIRNRLDEMYIDFGICDTDESVWGLITHLKENNHLVEEDIINNLENCSKNIRNLYSLYSTPDEVKNLIEAAILNENSKNAI
jgi:hypothetical protein